VTQELIIAARGAGVLGCLMEDGRLIDVAIEEENGGFRERLFLGRVRAVEPALDAAFIDLGCGEPALLSGRDARFATGAARGTPIARQLAEGEAVLVQGRREASGGKGPRVSADLALGGSLLVLRPRRADIGLSARLSAAPDAPSQRSRAETLFAEGGIVLRSAAREVGDAALMEEAGRLRALWREIEARAGRSRAPACVHEAPPPIERLLTGLAGPGVDRIVVCDHGAFLKARHHLERSAPLLRERLELAPDALSASGAEEQLEEALARAVPLAGGGRLIIEATAALIAIDVDGGVRAALEADLEAAGEIARQARLRRLGGTIVVDFVDLPSRRDQARLHSALRHAFEADPLPVDISPMNASGLIVIGRRRAGATLAEQLGRSCPVCAGEGRLRSLAWQSESLTRALGAQPGRRHRARLAPDLHHYLEDAGADAWRAFLERERPLVDLRSDASLPPGAFAIEPGERS
jgi:Rne/Rng family ribonuclease